MARWDFSDTRRVVTRTLMVLGVFIVGTGLVGVIQYSTGARPLDDILSTGLVSTGAVIVACAGVITTAVLLQKNRK